MSGGPGSGADPGDREPIRFPIEPPREFPPAGPAGSGTAGARGGRARGLYVTAWVAALVGIGLLGMAGLAAAGASPSRPAGPAALAMLFAALVVLTASLTIGASYQVLARADRPEDRYRGPSPLILFGVILLAVTLVVGALAGAGLIAPQSQSLGALADVGLTTAAYLVVIWFFVVRNGVLGWPAMGWPTGIRDTLGRVGGDAMAGVALMLPTYLLTILAGGILAALLGVELPSALPTPRTVPDALATSVAAVVIAPIGEESFFRGLALTAWWRDLCLRSALLRATVFFAAAHVLNVTASSVSQGLRMALLQFLVILPVGYVLGWLFSQRGIVASIAGHMTFNAIAVVLLLASALHG